MKSTDAQNEKRIPIRKRVLLAVLVITLAILVAAVVTSMGAMNKMREVGERRLSEELSSNLRHEVLNKASNTDAKLAAYRKYMEVIRDYTQNMYRDYDKLVATGKYFDTPRMSTGDGVYAMTSAFAHDNVKIEDYMDEIYFFSHLEAILEPMAKDNEEQISTIYLGTTTGLLVSYDRWSTLSAVPEPDFFIYDYFQSEWYTKGMTEDDIFFTSLYVDAMGRGLTITIATPIRDQNGVFQGVLAADFDITGVYNEMISMDLGTGSFSFAFESDRSVISLDLQDEVLLENYIDIDKASLEKMTSGKTGIIETSDAFYACAPIETVDWTLCAKVPRTVLLEKVQTLDRSFVFAMLVFLLVSVVLVLVGLFFANKVSKSITHPIELLVNDMKDIAGGSLDHKAAVYRNDEIGDMTNNLNEMVERLKGTISDLVIAEAKAAEMHEIASTDALTSVKSKSAYDSYTAELQSEIDRGDNPIFAIAVFDCDNLKVINDKYGHDKGDVYLITSSRLIGSIFKYSPVFRVGGDEFVAILHGEDYENRERLLKLFARTQEEIKKTEGNPWKMVSVSVGVATYNPKNDASVADTMRRADKLMYEDKAKKKAAVSPK